MSPYFVRPAARQFRKRNHRDSPLGPSLHAVLSYLPCDSWLLLVALLFLSTLVLHGAGASHSFARTSEQDTSPKSASGVTLAAYMQIQNGMTYEQVREIIGTAGEEISRSNIAGYSTVMYSWKNWNGSNMNAMFQNDQLVTKAQFGLR